MCESIQSMGELKDCFFEMLCAFDDFCTSNNIEYWLWAGTLIGSVRERDFIDWDDDVDIILTRESFDKLRSISDKIPKEYGIKYPGKGYFYDFITEFISNNYRVKRHKNRRNLQNSNAYVNPMIDIYVLDKCYTGFRHKLKIAHIFILYGLARGHREYNIPPDLGKRHNSKWPGFLVKPGTKLLGALGSVMDLDTIMRKYEKCVRKTEKNSDHLYISNDQPWCISKTFPQELFSGQSPMGSIRGRDFPIPPDYDGCLKLSYGNYMQQPPVKDRHPYHYDVEYRHTDSFAV